MGITLAGVTGVMSSLFRRQRTKHPGKPNWQREPEHDQKQNDQARTQEEFSLSLSQRHALTIAQSLAKWRVASGEVAKNALSAFLSVFRELWD